MLEHSEAFSGFSVDDLTAAKAFYAETLGLQVEEMEMGLLALKIHGGRDVLVYPKPDHAPASYTVLNFPVDDVVKTVDGLTARGVTFERYEGMGQDEKGIAHNEGPLIAWFTDPAGNVLSIIEG